MLSMRELKAARQRAEKIEQQKYTIRRPLPQSGWEDKIIPENNNISNSLFLKPINYITEQENTNFNKSFIKKPKNRDSLDFILNQSSTKRDSKVKNQTEENHSNRYKNQTEENNSNH